MENINIHNVFKIWKKDYENQVILLNKPDVQYNQKFVEAFSELQKTEQKEILNLIDKHKMERSKQLLFISLN